MTTIHSFSWRRVQFFERSFYGLVGWIELQCRLFRANCCIDVAAGCLNGSQQSVSIGVFWIELDAACQITLGIRRLTFSDVSAAQVVVRIGIVGSQLERFFFFKDLSIGVALQTVGGAEISVPAGVLRVEFQRLPKRTYRLVDPVLSHQ